MIAGSVVHLVFSVRNENTWTAAIIAIVGGIGLLLAGDATASVQKVDVAPVDSAVKPADTPKV